MDPLRREWKRFIRDCATSLVFGTGGEPIVMLHGFGSSTYTWRYIASPLSRTHSLPFWPRGALAAGSAELSGISIASSPKAMQIWRLHVTPRRLRGSVRWSRARRPPNYILGAHRIFLAADRFEITVDPGYARQLRVGQAGKRDRR